MARKGEVQHHHFGHQGTEDGRPCNTGPETALHKFAKEVLEQKLQLFLPTLDLWDGSERWVGFEGRSYEFDAAVLENRLGEIIPDVIIRKGNRDLIVEFAVTHECGPAKIAIMAEMDISAIEVDLSKLPRDISREGLENAILHAAPRKWLHNPKIREGQRELEIRRRRRADTLSRQVSPLLKAYRATLESHRISLNACLAVGRIKSDGMERAIGHNVPGSGCFKVPPRDWQATILSGVIEQAVVGRSANITIKDALRKIRDRDWINFRFTRISEDQAVVLRESSVQFEFPEFAIQAWAAALSRLSILVPVSSTGRWILHPMIIKEIQSKRTADKQSK
ncbi:hypothetical protein [Microvirga sp. Mcv34]|uniref:hypothetical protein n=1 Tax=Microvirga sp. Mcv34 TaxID=2926016 RepID=UPI0021C970C6|nr:hypothetical protein [Microvirga sp. Mcv34]